MGDQDRRGVEARHAESVAYRTGFLNGYFLSTLGETMDWSITVMSLDKCSLLHAQCCGICAYKAISGNDLNRQRGPTLKLNSYAISLVSMKLLFASLLSFGIAALAQSIAIDAPSEGQTLNVGPPVVVMVERPVSCYIVITKSFLNR